MSTKINKLDPTNELGLSEGSNMQNREESVARKRKRSKRIFNETSEAPVWYLQLWESISDTSSTKDVISNMDKSGFLRTLFTTIMPAIAGFLLIAPCVNTWDAIKNYYRSANRNFDKTLDLFVNIVMSVTSVAVMATLLAGVVYISPYILLIALSVSTGYALYNITKHAYRAFRAHQEGDEDRRRQHLMAIPRHIILGILSVLGLLTHLNNAFNITVFSSVFNVVEFSNTTYNVAEILVYTFGLIMTLGTMPAFARKVMAYNRETWDMVSHPLASFTKLADGLVVRFYNGYELCRQQPLKALLLFIPTLVNLTVEFIGFAAKVAARLFSVALAPVQLLGTAVSKSASFLMSCFYPAPQIHDLRDDPIPLEKQLADAQKMQSHLGERHAKLKADVVAHIEHLKTQRSTPKIISKLYYMRELEYKLGDNITDFAHSESVANVEAEAKIYSSRLYQSFWRQEGRVEKIARLAERLEYDVEDATSLGYVEARREVLECKEEDCEPQVNGYGHVAEMPNASVRRLA
jgi:hypothetical protein